MKIWRALGASSNPSVLQKVIAQSVRVDRDHFDMRIEAFRRLGLMSKEELTSMEEAYKADDERRTKEKETKSMKRVDRKKDRKKVRAGVYDRVQTSPHKALIDSGVWEREVGSLSVTEFNVLLLCMNTSSSSSQAPV